MGSKREYLGEGIYKEGDKFRIIIYLDGKRFVETCQARTFRQAKQMRAVRIQKIKEDKFFMRRKRSPITFKELMDNFLKYSKATKKSYERDKLSSNYLLNFFGKYKPEEITHSMIKTYIAKRLKETTRKGSSPSNATINRELALLRSVLYQAINDGIIDRNPMRGIKLLPEKARDRVLTPEEYQRLLNAAEPHIVPILRMAHDLAMCENEILTLTWDRVDFDRKVIILEEEHTKKRPREVPFSDEIEEMLRELRNYVGPIYTREKKGKKIVHRQITEPRPVFTYQPSERAEYRFVVKSIKRPFESAKEKAEIEDFRFHDLRHTAITNMRKAGVPENVRMRISGHKTLNIHYRYDTVDEQDLKEAINKTATYTATKRNEKKEENA